ncbi:Uncharacterised protein [Moraxella lacunata]|uniref:Uncharacterized protein n=1 Tax=Moraxella lacunata TaxID=477 RepID=A0A378TVS6_MORLA|nr:hypothetical protein [Moraxella lacunata]STZ64002.1 Uncharacterised protein [Moraxella lacunata]
MKQWESTFNNNHLRLMRVHIGLMIFYAVFFLFCSYFLYNLRMDRVIEISFLRVFTSVMLLYIPFFAFHLLLAIGAKRKSEMSRKISEIVFAIMLLGFPVGTILSAFYFLPKTIWKSKES